MKLKDAKYFGIKLSPNRIKNDKGQLIVTGCEFARTGKQKYHSSELGVEGDKFIYLDRPVEEVSDSKTVASFEGAPVTLDHPVDDVKVGVNYNELAKGFATNVKYIADSNKEGHLQADFVITDADLIKKIENHEIEELSAGYNCDVDEKDWVQRHIRGNHIAVVEQARAGHQARLRDKKYNLASKKIKTLKIGDKLVKVADSYSYELEEDGKKVKYTDYYTTTSSGKKKFVKTVRDSLYDVSKADANKIRQWWKDVNEYLYNGTIDMSTIDDPEAIEDWIVTMYDVLLENKDKKEYNDLLRRGKALYNKYATMSPFNYRFTDDEEEDTIDDLIDDEREAVEGYEKAMKNSPDRNKAVYSHIINEELEHIEELKGIKRFKSNDSAVTYVWKKDGDDHILTEKGKDKALITLSRMNSGFPWTVYKGNKEITIDAESDKLADIKDYILKNIDKILGKKSVKDTKYYKNYNIEYNKPYNYYIIREQQGSVVGYIPGFKVKNNKDIYEIIDNKKYETTESFIKDKKSVKDSMYYWQAVNDDLHKKLAKAGYIDGRNFSTFTRPNKHLIIEAFSKDRDGILEVLKSTKYNVVENDEWSGGNRIGIIIPEWFKEVDDDFKIKDSDDFVIDEDDDKEVIINNRKDIDNSLKEIFSDSCFDLSGFREGNESTEGSIYVIDVNPWLDEGCYHYVEDNYEEDFDDEFLDLACEYFDREINKRIKKAGIKVNDIDVDIVDWSGDEEFPINAHIYCEGVTK